MSNSSTTNNNDLDLSQVDNESVDQLAQKIEGFYKSDSSSKSQLAKHWERNHLMLDGKQWIIYDGNESTGGIWKQLKVSKANEYIPRPVTNYIFDAYQTLKAYLIKNKPRSSVRPNTQTHTDKTAAKIATLCIDANFERLKEEQNYEYASAVMVTYGTVFKKDYWDTTALSYAKIPLMQMVPKTDPMTGQVVGQEEIAVLDENGQPEYQQLPLGDVNTSIIEPYRLAIDPLAADIHSARWIMEYSIQPLEWIQETYDKQEEGYTGKVGEVKAEKSLSGSLRRFYHLKTSAGVKSGGLPSSTSGGGTSSDEIIENAAVVKEYYERPSRNYPKGRLVVVANGITLYAGESPYEGPEQGDWHPYSECRWEVVPGRFWGKSPLDDACEIQKQINSIDSAIILTRKTMAVPQKRIPLSIGVNPGQWTGRPGQEIFYRDNGTGAKPENIEAAGVAQQVFQEREQRREDLKQITGAIDILKGDRPPGVTAASALSLLYEVGTGKLFPVLGRWKTFVENSQKKQLKLIAKYYQEPRPDFIKLLRSKNKELSEEDVNKFIGTDLHDNCNVIVEAGSNIPKLLAAEQAKLMEAAQLGILNLDVPENRMEFQKRLGITGFDNDVGPDVKRALWENDLMDNIPNSPDNKPVVLDVDDHEIHKEIHGRRMKEPSFMSLPFEVQQIYMVHYQEHEQKIEQAMQMQQMQAIATGQPPMGPEPSGNEPSPPTKMGKGATAELKNAVMGDALTPGGLGQE